MIHRLDVGYREMLGVRCGILGDPGCLIYDPRVMCVILGFPGRPGVSEGS